MTFEVFQKPARGRPANDTPKVRINGNGITMHLNTKARQELGSPSHVLLHSDGTSIAFSAAGPDDAQAYILTRGNISCSLFIHAAGLIPGVRLDLRLEDGLLRSDGRE